MGARRGQRQRPRSGVDRTGSLTLRANLRTLALISWVKGSVSPRRCEPCPPSTARDRHEFRIGKWHYRFQANGRTYYGPTDSAATEQNRTKAARIEAQAHRLVTQGKAEFLKLEAVPFSEAATAFLSWADGKHRDHPATARRLRTSFASLNPFFKNQMAHTITESRVDDYAPWRRREHRVRVVTIRHDTHALSKFFQHAAKHNWRLDNPVRKAELPSDAVSMRIHVLSAAEEQKYFAAARRFPNLYDLGRLMLNQGCRPDELMSSRQADVDLGHGVLHVRGGKTRQQSGL